MKPNQNFGVFRERAFALSFLLKNKCSGTDWSLFIPASLIKLYLLCFLEQVPLNPPLI